MPRCPVCNKFIKRASGLHAHIRKYHPDYKPEEIGAKIIIREKQCPICGKWIKQEEWDTHKKEHEYEQLKEENKRLRKENEELKKALQEARKRASKIDNLQKELEKLRKENEKLKQERDNLKDAKIKLETQLKEITPIAKHNAEILDEIDEKLHKLHFALTDISIALIGTHSKDLEKSRRKLSKLIDEFEKWFERIKEDPEGWIKEKKIMIGKLERID